MVARKVRTARWGRFTPAMALLLGGTAGVLIPLVLSTSPASDYWSWGAVALILIPILYLIWKKTGAPLLWSVLLLATSLSFRRRDPSLLDTDVALDAQVLIQLILYAWVGVYALAQALRHPRQVLGAILEPPQLWVFLFGLVALFSTAYSEYRLLTLVRSLQLLIMIALLAVLVSVEQVSARRILDVTERALLYIVVGVLAVYVIRPEMALTLLYPNLRRLGGLLIHPNGLGAVSAALGVAALSKILGARGRFERLSAITSLAVSIIALAGAQGRATIAAWLLGSGVVLILWGRSTRILGLLCVAVFLALVLLLPQETAEWTSAIVRPETIGTLTGRLAVWRFVIVEATSSLQALFLGHGFASARLEFLDALPGQWTHAHNAFLESIYGLGLIGLFAFAMSLLSLITSLLKGLRGNPKGQHFVYVELLGLTAVVSTVAMASSVIGRLDVAAFIYLSLIASCTQLKLPGRNMISELPTGPRAERVDTLPTQIPIPTAH
jgi:O-antigen ligase